MAVNVRGIMLCYKYAATQMVKQGRGGRIIGRISQLALLAISHVSYTGASSVAGKKGMQLEHTTGDVHL